MQITVAPFVLLALAVPVLLMGEQLVKRVRWLGRLNIPAPIVGGLIISLLVLLVQKASPGSLTLLDRVASVPWHWLALDQLNFSTPEAWATKPPPYVYTPLLILFFTCIGLNASWSVAKSGGLPLLGYLALATAFAAIQYGVGIGTAILTGVDPLVGIMCSGVSLMGGFGTATSWAPDFEKSGPARCFNDRHRGGRIRCRRGRIARRAAVGADWSRRRSVPAPSMENITASISRCLKKPCRIRHTRTMSPTNSSMKAASSKTSPTWPARGRRRSCICSRSPSA